MIRPVGHEHVIRALEQGLPPVTLLKGPRSVGKMTIAEYLVDYHHVHPADLVWCEVPLKVDQVRDVIAFVSTMSAGPFKLVLADLDGASEAAFNALLKTLEEPPPSARFILSASQSVPATVESRAAIFTLGLLSRCDLAAILMTQGMSESAAVRAAVLARGQVDAAMTTTGTDAARAAVLTLIRALAQHDQDLFHRVARSFDDTARELFVRFLIEAISGMWVLFSHSDTCGLTGDPGRLMSMLRALTQVSRARPRLQVRVALQPFLLPG
jgi:DNA polymerase III delta prime subunit